MNKRNTNLTPAWLKSYLSLEQASWGCRLCHQSYKKQIIQEFKSPGPEDKQEQVKSNSTLLARKKQRKYSNGLNATHSSNQILFKITIWPMFTWFDICICFLGNLRNKWLCFKNKIKNELAIDTLKTLPGKENSMLQRFWGGNSDLSIFRGWESGQCVYHLCTQYKIHSHRLYIWW